MVDRILPNSRLFAVAMSGACLALLLVCYADWLLSVQVHLTAAVLSTLGLMLAAISFTAGYLVATDSGVEVVPPTAQNAGRIVSAALHADLYEALAPISRTSYRIKVSSITGSPEARDYAIDIVVVLKKLAFNAVYDGDAFMGNPSSGLSLGAKKGDPLARAIVKAFIKNEAPIEHVEWNESAGENYVLDIRAGYQPRRR